MVTFVTMLNKVTGVLVLTVVAFVTIVTGFPIQWGMLERM